MIGFLQQATEDGTTLGAVACVVHRGSALGAVTLRQLLAHTGGLAAWRRLYQELFPADAFFPTRSIGHLGFTGGSVWSDLEHHVTVILCTNRVHPTRHTTGITSLRPAVHNHIMHALGVATS